MHAGKITNPRCAAGRVYTVLSGDPGRWISGWDLTMLARTTAIGTRISEVRSQLPPGQAIEHISKLGDERGSWYRFTLGSQMTMNEILEWKEKTDVQRI